MRLDGFFCDFNADDKKKFLKKLYDLGVRNIEMESVGFAAYTYRAKISGFFILMFIFLRIFFFLAAVVCVTLVNRFITDQITLTKDEYENFEMRPFHLITSFISEQCNLKKKI